MFFTILLVIDKLFGVGCRYCMEHAKGGDQYKAYYISKKCNDDVLIFGSSRANHHYNPLVLEDSLNMSVYNCGTDGNGIILQYGRLLMITNRYAPKLILYDVVPKYDIESNDNMKYLYHLKPFYDEPGVAPLFSMVNENERYKMLSYMYRYNSRFVQVLSDYVYPQQSVINGYNPMYGIMDYEPDATGSQKSYIEGVDALKLECFKNFIVLCKKKQISLILMVSPLYKGTSIGYLQPIEDLARQMNVPLYNHSDDIRFCNKKNFFNDASHLNNEGASAFTKTICEEIRKEIGNPNSSF